MKCTLFLLLGFVLVLARSVSAVPINYTFAGFGSGSAGGVLFTDAAFTITVQADTAQVKNPVPRFPFIFDTGAAPTLITLAGMGSGSFLSGLSVYVHQRIPELGLTEPGANDLFAVRDALFASYDLRSDLGPFLEPEPEDFVTFVNLPSTLGPVTLADVRDITFSATTAAQPIPEPRTWQLSLVGATALLAVRRWRGSSAARQ